MSTKATIVIIEDEKNICSFISRILEPEGYRVITSNTGRNGLQHINSNHPDLILLDLGLPDMDGLDIIQNVRIWSYYPYYCHFCPYHGKQQSNSTGYGR